MNLLYRALGLDKIYSVLSWFMVATLAVLLFLFAPTWLIATSWSNATTFEIILGAAYIVLVFISVRELVQALFAWRRIKSREYIIPITTTSMVTGTSIEATLSGKDFEINQKTIEEGQFWSVSDVRFDVFHEGKGARYRTSELYYTVFEAKLQRIVPNVVFDSNRAKGRQFRFNYVHSQKLSFEGGVDSVFSAYSPETYQIDTLSFISPEVLAKIMNLTDCDIEFNNDHLYIFGSLLSMSEVEDLKNRALQLYASVNDNLDSYRDDRLLGNARIKNVTDFGKKLLISPAKFLPIMIITGTALVEELIRFIFDKSYVFNQGLLYLVLIFAISSWKVIRIIHANHRRINEFKNLLPKS